MFDAKYYQNNRRRLLDALPPKSLVVIAGHEQMQKVADLTYPFRQDSNMLYLAGVQEPNVVLAFSANTSILIVDKRSEFTSLWDGQLSLEDLQKQTGVDLVVEGQPGWKQLYGLLKSYNSVGILEPISSLPWGGAANPARKNVLQRLKRNTSKGHTFVDIRPQLAQLRTAKQPQEIEALQRAADITTEGYEAVMDVIDECEHEYQLQAAFTHAFQFNNTDHAYDPIIGSGRRSCVLHYTDNDQPIEDNLVLFDVAAQYENYAADVSRTVPHIHAFSDRQQAVYDAVLHVQLETIAKAAPGMSFVELDAFTRDEMAKVLADLGLSKAPSKEDVRRYFPHTSHFIGLDVHDAGDYKAPLPEHAVITVEPGIYIPEEGIGVRIEDMLHLHDGGNTNMTTEIPK